MKEETDIPIVEIHLKEIKDFEYKFETPAYTMESQTNEDRLFVNWRPTSVIPESGKDILLALIGNERLIGYYSDGWYRNVYHKDDVITGVSVPERNVLGWMPIPTPPKEKIM